MKCPRNGWELEAGSWRMPQSLDSPGPVCTSSIWTGPSAWLLLWPSHFVSTGSAALSRWTALVISFFFIFVVLTMQVSEVWLLLI